MLRVHFTTVPDSVKNTLNGQSVSDATGSYYCVLCVEGVKRKEKTMGKGKEEKRKEEKTKEEIKREEKIREGK